MNTCIRFVTVKGKTKIMQMDKLLPRVLHRNLKTTTLFFSSSPAPHFHHSFLKFHNNNNNNFSEYYYSTMQTNRPQGTKEDEQREGLDRDSVDYSDQTRFADHILPHLLNMYGSRASAQDFEIYAPNATFEDPLMRAEGVQQIKSAFYSLAKVFSESRIVEYNINENVISPGKKEINIDNKQYYKFLGKDIHMISLIKLHMENGKIVRHEDWWNKKPLPNKETVKTPLVGGIAEMTRRAAMMATHALMGFGKDPTPPK